MPRGTYNFSLEDVADRDWSALFTVRRRDATFAFSIDEPSGFMILGRDHLGIVPLFWRARGGRVESSIFLEDLLDGDETVSDEGLRTYIALGTAKVTPLFNEIHVVPPGTVIRASPSGTAETLYSYRIEPRRTTWWTFKKRVDELDHLLTQAVKRTLTEKEIGLYFSGGVDSGLTGVYLKRAGALIRGYTANPWGPESQEARLAALNATSIGVKAHTQYPLETEAYARYIERAPELYGNPCGATSELAILALLNNTDVLKETQVYFAQNADTASSSVPDQSLLYFVSFAPRFVQRRLHRMLKGKNLADNYAAFRTVGLVRRSPFSERLKGYGRLATLTLSGMLFGHTPVDSDIVVLPALKRGQKVSNIYYDMDVVEFLLGVPLWHRVSFSPESKIGIAIDKRVVRALGARYLSPEVVSRKKGLNVPVARDHVSRTFFAALPKKIGGIDLALSHHRFAAELLKRYVRALPTGEKILRALTHE